jgi:hypothetical protein
MHAVVHGKREATKNVPDRQWEYQELIRIHPRSIEMPLGSSFAAKDCGDASARGGRNEDLKKLYQNARFGGHGKSEAVTDPVAGKG